MGVVIGFFSSPSCLIFIRGQISNTKFVKKCLFCFINTMGLTEALHPELLWGIGKTGQIDRQIECSNSILCERRLNVLHGMFGRWDLLLFWFTIQAVQKAPLYIFFSFYWWRTTVCFSCFFLVLCIVCVTLKRGGDVSVVVSDLSLENQ